MNIQRRILNKVFCQFVDRRSEAISLFDVQRSMFDVKKTTKTFSLDQI